MEFTIPTVVVLSMWIGVEGCGWPSSARVMRRIFASWAFRNKAPSSASAAEAATSLRIVQLMWTAPLRKMGSLSTGIDPKKKYPPARLRAL